MLLTIRVPELNNKEFSFKDSTANIKMATRLMKKSFQDQVDAQEASEVSEENKDISKMSDEEYLQYQIEQNKKQIHTFDTELKSIDFTIEILGKILGLNKKDSSILEELSLTEIGELLAHVSFRLNNPGVSEDEYWDLQEVGSTKK
ncbi:phage tail tube assembly chaperone [Oenococcus oeni]|uniref:ORFF; NCBI gi: 806602 n=4 Tax=root TaxID=1 RepID=Q38222_9VIRU|nr:phage tail tube assembly chaperone [Oenococcus oeni]AAA66335.1 ORFF [Leuconostoc phage L10]AWW99654.1 hypothetical protein C5H79_09410 [Oenococcus oeni]EKP90478.1 putative phage protein [Oenococcus oeni AWRIB202]KGH57011.1 hypothetical protein X289_06685 [Oenococcus oeni IOEB_B10]OIK76371.1 hypothetical protein ATW70_00315 [Oenococcus oeni]